MTHRLIPIFAALLLCSPSVQAQTTSYEHKDLAAGAAKATAEMHAQANRGDAMAQWNLGIMYAKGQGVKENAAESVKWFRKASDQGFAAAQYELGVVCATGQGVPKNEVEAFKWLTQIGRASCRERVCYPV